MFLALVAILAFAAPTTVLAGDYSSFIVKLTEAPELVTEIDITVEVLGNEFPAIPVTINVTEIDLLYCEVGNGFDVVEITAWPWDIPPTHGIIIWDPTDPTKGGLTSEWDVLVDDKALTCWGFNDQLNF
jgi:hypothetical protein